MEVIVPPPNVDIESGVVPYGTKVTISPAYGIRYKYSVNNKEFENPDASDTVITITEDTSLVVQSIVDDREPNTAYLCLDALYMYTVDKNTIPEKYPYTINSAKFISTSGEEYRYVSPGMSCIVDAEITKNTARSEKDYFVVAVYGKDHELLSLNYIKANIPVNESFSIGVNIPKMNKEIDYAKIFVWDSLGGMTPLAQGHILINDPPLSVHD